MEVGSLKARVELDTRNVNADLARVREELIKTNEQLRNLEEAARESGDASEATAERIEALRARTVELRKSVAELSVTTASQTAQMQQLATATHQVSTAMVQAGGNINSTMMGMQRLSRSMLYMTSGEPMTMLHQLPRAFGGLAQAAGMGTVAVAGLTTGVGLAAAAGVLLYNHYGDIERLFIGEYTKTEAQHMEELENATHRTAAETKELHKYKKAIADLDKLNSMSSDAEKARAKTVEHTIGEVGPGKAQRAVAQGLFDSAKEEMGKLSERIADMRAAAAANGGAMSEAEQGKYNELETQRVTLKNKHAAGPGAFNADATDLLLNAAKPEGKESFDKIRKLMAAKPGTFGGGLISGFQAASPEQQKLDQEGKDQGTRLTEEAHAKKEARSELVDSLNRQGQEGEREARDENPEVFEKAGHRRRREEAEAKKAGRHDETSHYKQLADYASTYRPAYSREIASAMNSDRSKGKGADASDATIAGNLRKQLAKSTDIPETMLDEVAAKLVGDVRKKFAGAVIQAANEGSEKPIDQLLGNGPKHRVSVAHDLGREGDDAPGAGPAPPPLTRAQLRAARKAAVLAAARAKHGKSDDDADDAQAPKVRVRPLPGLPDPQGDAERLIAVQRQRDAERLKAAREAIQAQELRKAEREESMKPPGRPIGKNGLPVPEDIRPRIDATDKTPGDLIGRLDKLITATEETTKAVKDRPLDTVAKFR